MIMKEIKKEEIDKTNSKTTSMNKNGLNFDVNELTARLEEFSGHNISSPSDCEWLAKDFETRANEKISVNTLKRLLGFLTYNNRTHYKSTLDTVARYLGYKDSDELGKSMSIPASGFGCDRNIINSSDLEEDDTIDITYRPGRSISLEYLGDHKYTISDCENTHLMYDDILTIHQFVIGQPLYIMNVRREGKDLGVYTCARLGGLTSLKLNE